MTSPDPSLDERMMRRALDLAERGTGWTSPNPMVGAVVCRGEEILAEAWHERVGEAHAERKALDLAGEKAAGATLYVTLEPCAHHGRTPPCVDRVLESGVERVVVAMRDPNPLVDGRSITRLRESGIRVEVGVCEREARFLNRAFLSWILRKKPWVTLKYAMTLDGRIATRSGNSRWISNEASRAIVHDLRRRHRAVLVGYRTALADNPLLTCRLETTPPPRQPLRVVWGGDRHLPPRSNLAKTASRIETLHILRKPLAGDSDAGVETICLGKEKGEPVENLLMELHRREVDSVLVEGGAEVLSRFLSSGSVDEIYVFVAPKILNDREAIPPFPGEVSKVSMEETTNLHTVTIRAVEDDSLIHGFLSDLWTDPEKHA